DGRQRLVLHIGTGVQILVERGADDLAGDLAGVLGLAQRAAEISPVEREDYVRLAHQRACVVAEHIEWLGEVRGMVGRKGRALLEIGEHAGAEPLREPNARPPELVAARATA